MGIKKRRVSTQNQQEIKRMGGKTCKGKSTDRRQQEK